MTSTKLLLVSVFGALICSGIGSTNTDVQVYNVYDTWRPYCEYVAELALEELNQQRRSDEGRLKMSHVEVESTMIGTSVMYTLGLELDYGMKTQFQFLDPVEWKHLWAETLYSPWSEADSTDEVITDGTAVSSPYKLAPSLPEIPLQGPLSLYLKTAQEPSMKVPKRLETGPFAKMTITDSSTINLSGLSSIQLRGGVGLEFHSVADKLAVELKGDIRLDVHGKGLEFASTDKLKVKRKNNLELEVCSANRSSTQNPDTTSSSSLHTRKMLLHENNPIVKNLQMVMTELNKRLLSDKPSRIVNLWAARVEAVNCFLVKMVLNEPAGSSEWEAVIIRTVEGQNKVISHKKRHQIEQVALDHAILANNTWGESLSPLVRQIAEKAAEYF